MTPEERFYERALERIRRNIMGLTAFGTVAAFLWQGWSWGLGFGLGASASWLNYRWLTGIVNALGRTGNQSRRARVAIVGGLRYLILGLGAYVILRGSNISVPAALAGLFVPAASVLVEMLYQLAYVRD